MHPLIAQQLRTGLPGLRGSHLHGAVPLSQAVVAALLRDAPSPLRDVRIDIQAGNRLVVRYGIVQATATLDASLTTGAAPRLGMELASSVVAWTLRQVLRLPYLRVEGRRVTVDLAAIPALADYRALWPHLREARVATTPGMLVVGFDVRVG